MLTRNMVHMKTDASRINELMTAEWEDSGNVLYGIDPNDGGEVFLTPRDLLNLLTDIETLERLVENNDL